VIVAFVAAVASVAPVRAQLGSQISDWQQRFLGIIPSSAGPERSGSGYGQWRDDHGGASHRLREDEARLINATRPEN